MVDLAEVKCLIAAVNAARWPAVLVAGNAPENAEAAEQKLEAMFQANQTLAVYGTLAPGKPNHHIVAPYTGEWSDGIVEGDLSTVGWGAALGYPAFKPRAGGPLVNVKVLKSPLLLSAWADIDAFEGAEYQRILVPVIDTNGQLATVANLYACYPPDAQ